LYAPKRKIILLFHLGRAGIIYVLNDYREATMNKLTVLKNTIDILEISISSKKKEFETIIADKSIALKDRWKLFREAPYFLKDHAPWIEHFYMYEYDPVDPASISLQRDSDITHDKGFNRNEEVDVVNLIDQYREDIVADEFPDTDFETIGQIDQVVCSKDARLNEIKEDILSRNLGSFCYDW
jgi:hypothetical protein